MKKRVIAHICLLAGIIQWVNTVNTHMKRGINEPTRRPGKSLAERLFDKNSPKPHRQGRQHK